MLEKGQTAPSETQSRPLFWYSACFCPSQSGTCILHPFLSHLVTKSVSFFVCFCTLTSRLAHTHLQLISSLTLPLFAKLTLCVSVAFCYLPCSFLTCFSLFWKWSLFIPVFHYIWNEITRSCHSEANKELNKFTHNFLLLVQKYLYYVTFTITAL